MMGVFIGNQTGSLDDCRYKHSHYGTHYVSRLS